ncbi:MAG: class I SAM-dependent methyltransferase [Balneolaceae bacterium]|nr:class I SAM-dependent methyltransferase [Balneolaceae bacterium]
MSKIRYTGIDISKLMVEQASGINKEWIEERRADFILTDGKKIPFQNKQFDLVFSVNTIYFWEEPANY